MLIFVRSLFTFIFTCLVYYGLAQTQLSGEVTNVAGERLSGATIMIKNKSGYIQQYTSTSSSGTFTLSVVDSLLRHQASLDVSLLGFKRFSQSIAGGQVFFKIVLEESTTLLDEVKVKPRGIISIGDTLRYDVSSFAKDEDRSIGDVIRRLPGVTVSDEGQIFFNGKAISNLFIHGDDLMDGRYGLATKAITKDMIKSIDVMKNHQPIKVLKDRVPSDDVAMNLVLKDENSLKLSGKIDVGYGPTDLVDVGVTPILLNKKIKTLTSLKFNNMGSDVSGELKQLGSTTSGSNVSTGLKTILNKPGAVSLDVPKQNYYFNNSGIFNTNNVYNFLNGWQMKTNIQFYLDQNTTHHIKDSKVFVEGNTFSINENMKVENTPLNFQSSVTLTANKTAYFLENKLSYNYSNYKNISQLLFNAEAIGSRFRERKNEFLNSFYYIPQLKGNDVLDFRWSVGYYNAPQSLRIDTGVNANFFNDGIIYEELQQLAEIPSYVSQAYLTFRKKTDKLIRQNYEVAAYSEIKDFESMISILPNGSDVFEQYDGDVGNDLKWQQHRFQFNPNFSLVKNAWNIVFSLPITYRYVHYNQKEYSLDKNVKDLVVLPKLNLRYKMNAEDEVAFSYSNTNDVGNLATVYRGILVQDYRSITKNDSYLLQNNSSNYRFNYKFERSIHMFFMNVGAFYQRISQNNMLSQSFSENLEEAIYLGENNEQKNLTYNFSVGKYIFPLASNLNMETSYFTGKSQQYINEQKIPFNNKYFTVKGSAVTKPVNFLSLDMSVSWNKFWSLSTNKNGLNIDNTARNLNYTLNAGFTLVKNLLLNSKVYHMKTQGLSGQNSATFLDANMRYTLKKFKTDINLSLINLMDTKRYKQYFVSSNQIIFTDYNLRGRMAVVSTNFYF